jgi:hypothetical protein
MKKAKIRVVIPSQPMFKSLRDSILMEKSEHLPVMPAKVGSAK